MTTTHSNTAPAPRRAQPFLWAGLALTLVTGAYALIDSSTTQVLADHVRGAYSSYGAPEVEAAVQIYVGILLGVTALGAVGWLTTIWAVRSDKRWTRWLATAFLAAAVVIAMIGLTTMDTSGEVGLAPLMGWLLLLPCLPGVVAVVKLWRHGGRG